MFKNLIYFYISLFLAAYHSLALGAGEIFRMDFTGARGGAYLVGEKSEDELCWASPGASTMSVKAFLDRRFVHTHLSTGLKDVIIPGTIKFRLLVDGEPQGQFTAHGVKTKGYSVRKYAVLERDQAVKDRLLKALRDRNLSHSQLAKDVENNKLSNIEALEWNTNLTVSLLEGIRINKHRVSFQLVYEAISISRFPQIYNSAPLSSKSTVLHLASTPELYCPSGSYDGANCHVPKVAGKPARVNGRDLYFRNATIRECETLGGLRSAFNCLAAVAPKGTSSFVYKDELYYSPSCGPVISKIATVGNGGDGQFSQHGGTLSCNSAIQLNFLDGADSLASYRSGVRYYVGLRPIDIFSSGRWKAQGGKSGRWFSPTSEPEFVRNGLVNLQSLAKSLRVKLKPNIYELHVVRHTPRASQRILLDLRDGSTKCSEDAWTIPVMSPLL